MLRSSSGVAAKPLSLSRWGIASPHCRAAEPRATPSIDNGYGSDNTKSLLPDAVQMLICANEDLAVGNCRRAQAVIVQGVFRQHFKLRPGLDHGRQSVFVGHVDLSISQHRRAAIRTGLDALLPVNFGARPRIQAPHDAAIVDDVKVFSVSDRRRHIRSIAAWTRAGAKW